MRLSPVGRHGAQRRGSAPRRRGAASSGGSVDRALPRVPRASTAGAWSKTMRSMPAPGARKKPLTVTEPPPGRMSRRSASPARNTPTSLWRDAAGKQQLVDLVAGCAVDDDVDAVAGEIDIAVAPGPAGQRVVACRRRRACRRRALAAMTSSPSLPMSRAPDRRVRGDEPAPRASGAASSELTGCVTRLSSKRSMPLPSTMRSVLAFHWMRSTENRWSMPSSDTATKFGTLCGIQWRLKRDGHLAGAGVIDDVGAVGGIVELRLSAVHDVESRATTKEVVALAAVELLDLPRRRAAFELVAAAAAQHGGEPVLGAHAIVGAGAEQRCHSRRQMQPVRQPLRRIMPGVVDQRGDCRGGIDGRRRRARQAEGDVGVVLGFDVARIARHFLPRLQLIAPVRQRPAAAVLGRADLVGEVGARGEIGVGERQAAVGAFDAEEGAVGGRLAHTLHDEPVVLQGAVAGLEHELQMIEPEQPQAIGAHRHPFDANARQSPPPGSFLCRAYRAECRLCNLRLQMPTERCGASPVCLGSGRRIRWRSTNPLDRLRRARSMSWQ